MTNGTPEKKDWLQLAKIAAEELDVIAHDIQNTINETVNRIEDLKDGIDWGWDLYRRPDGDWAALYWDEPTEEDREMLDAYAIVYQRWREVKKQLQISLDNVRDAVAHLNPENDQNKALII